MDRGIDVAARGRGGARAGADIVTADVVVVGAGCAGLATATALADAGVRVVVVEARPVLGGRTFATRDTTSGGWVDNGQHVLFGCYHETLTYLDRIGSRDRCRVQSSLAVPMIDQRGRETALQCAPLPSPWHLAAGVLAWPALSWRDRLSMLPLARALAPSSGPPSPDETVLQWLARHGQSARLCELLWEPLALAALNQPIDAAAATTFVEVLRRMLGPGPDDAALVLPASSLSDVFVDPAVAHLGARGGAIEAGARARISVSDDRVAGVRVGERLIETRVVVSAVPWHALAGLFEIVPAEFQEIVRRASAMRSSPIVTANLWFDREVLETPFLGLPGRTFQWAFDARRVTGLATHVSMVCSGADDVVALSNDAIVARALADLAGAMPSARRATLLRGTAVRERHATFSLAPGEPPRPATKTALRGFLLAGDWTDTALPATIEGAVLSGHRAARAALEFFARPSPQPPAPSLR